MQARATIPARIEDIRRNALKLPENPYLMELIESLAKFELEPDYYDSVRDASAILRSLIQNDHIKIAKKFVQLFSQHPTLIFNLDEAGFNALWYAIPRDPSLAVQIAEQLFKTNARYIELTLKQTDGNFRNILHKAIANPVLVKMLIDLCPTDLRKKLVNRQDKDWQIPLHIACEARNIESISHLINGDSDLFILNNVLIWREDIHLLHLEKAIAKAIDYWSNQYYERNITHDEYEATIQPLYNQLNAFDDKESNISQVGILVNIIGGIFGFAALTLINGLAIHRGRYVSACYLQKTVAHSNELLTELHKLEQTNALPIQAQLVRNLETQVAPIGGKNTIKVLQDSSLAINGLFTQIKNASILSQTPLLKQKECVIEINANPQQADENTPLIRR